jgi:hypothetical protein
MTPQRIQRKRTKGYKMPPNTVSVTRPGRYGNPFVVGRDGTAEECTAKFRAAWNHTIACAKRDRTPYMPFGKPIFLGPLIGKNLACFCREDAPFCHADVLLEIASSVPHHEANPRETAL